MTGLSLLAPPLCCDPDVYALHTLALSLATLARHVASEGVRSRIDGAADFDVLDAAVERALVEHDDDLRHVARVSQHYETTSAHEHAAEAMSYATSAWRHAMRGLRPLVRVTHATHAPATAGAAHVDADGREVSP